MQFFSNRVSQSRHHRRIVNTHADSREPFAATLDVQANFGCDSRDRFAGDTEHWQINIPYRSMTEFKFILCEPDISLRNRSQSQIISDHCKFRERKSSFSGDSYEFSSRVTQNKIHGTVRFRFCLETPDDFIRLIRDFSIAIPGGTKTIDSESLHLETCSIRVYLCPSVVRILSTRSTSSGKSTPILS